MSDLNFIEYKDAGAHRRKLRRLYRTAFPREERAPFRMLKAGIKTGKASLYAIEDAGTFVGLAYLVPYRDIVYLFYLAIHASLRGKGCGSRILKAVTEKYSGRRVILNIETLDPKAENYPQRVKRKEFYEKNGFRDLGYATVEFGVAYEMFSYQGKTVSREEYLALIENLFGEKYFRLGFVQETEE